MSPWERMRVLGYIRINIPVVFRVSSKGKRFGVVAIM
jgi:hypothetical protein